MYEAFYGLKEKPFNLTPDPRFLYLSDKHKEAFAHLLFGIKNRSGFVMLTGEIGTGKTTICRNLLNQLDPDTELAFVFNPSLSPLELLKKINTDFGIESKADDLLGLTEELNEYLLRAAGEGKNCVLVIDEAQNLSPQVLEQIRLLSNLETETDKLLQIILIGQPELGENLQLRELRQLNQRITARYHLKALTEKETQQYIAYRLHVAGARRKVNFTKGAVRQAFRHSGGVPRVINAVCDRALLIGYTRETAEITASIVKQAAREIRGARFRAKGAAQAGWRRFVPSPSVLLAAILLILLIQYFVGPLERATRELGVFNTIMSTTVPPKDAPGPSAPQTASAVAPESAPTIAPGLDDPAVTPLAKAILESMKQMELPQQAAPVPDLGEALAQLDPAEARNAAAAGLLRAWRLAPVNAYPADDTTESLVAFAKGVSLDAEPLRAALDQLLTINLPAFVKMGSADGPRWLGLMGKDGDGVRLTTQPDQTIDVPRHVFVDHFTGEAVVLWRDPDPAAPVLRPFMTGKLVRDLQERLQRLGRLPRGEARGYDTATASAVSRIQAEAGLLVDGIAGRQVRMVLSSWLPDGEIPALGVSVPDTRVSSLPPPAATSAPQVSAPETFAPPPAATPAVTEPAASTDSGIPIVDVSPPADSAVEPPAPQATEGPETLPEFVPESGPVSPEAPPAPAKETPVVAPDAGVPGPEGAAIPESHPADNAGDVASAPAPKAGAADTVAEPGGASEGKRVTEPALAGVPLVPHQGTTE